VLTIDVRSSGSDKLNRKLAELKRVNKANVKVGFFDKATYSDGTSVAYVAYLNEYGGHNPPRPFMKRTVKNNSNKWVKGIKASLKQSGLTADGISLAFHRAGLVAVGDVKRTIMDWHPNDPRPNSLSTIAIKARRGREGKNLQAINPRQVLVDTGRMVGAVMYEVKV
jgi:hypothetical protein